MTLLVIAVVYPLVLVIFCVGWWFLLAELEGRRMSRSGTAFSDMEIYVFVAGVPLMVATAISVGIVAYLT